MANIKATHSGHCQACGRLQRLPNGKLAKHGYTIRGGYFSGVCVGSDHLPFEESFAMLPGFIAGAQTELVRVQAVSDKWTANTSNVVMVLHYEKKDFSYRWMKVTLEFEHKAFTDGSDWARAFYTVPGTTDRKAISTYDAYTEPAIIAQLNKRYTLALEPVVKDLNDYISWQKQRIASWTLQPLIPVATKVNRKAEKLVEFAPKTDMAVEA